MGLILPLTCRGIAHTVSFPLPCRPWAMAPPPPHTHILAHAHTHICLLRRWGVPLIDGGTVRLPRLIGLSRAMDLIREWCCACALPSPPPSLIHFPRPTLVSFVLCLPVQ
jgi:hypothetical protein